jgi:hypothetical protein
MSIPHTIAVDEHGNSSATLLLPDGVLTITGPSADGTGGHPNYRRIINALQLGEDVTPHLSVTAAILGAVPDERVVIEDGQVKFNGEVVHSNLTRTIIRYQSEGRDTTNLVKFLERLDANPSRKSREQLWDWIQAQDLVIDKDGYIIAYKGVNRQTQTGDDGESLERLVSSRSGPGIVNGVEMNGYLPNDPGNVVEMHRKDVMDDPNVHCSVGLHVANFRYAKNWASVLLEVRVDPADVVSIPNDSNGEKMRCCRYEVIGIHEDEHDTVAEKFEPAAGPEVTLDSLEDAGTPSHFMDKLRARFARRS